MQAFIVTGVTNVDTLLVVSTVVDRITDYSGMRRPSALVRLDDGRRGVCRNEQTKANLVLYGGEKRNHQKSTQHTPSEIV